MQKGTFGKAMRYLVVVGTLVSALALVACGGDDDGQDVGVNVGLTTRTVVAVQGVVFTIPNGQVFSPAITGAVTLTFDLANVNTFTLVGSGGNVATGLVAYSSGSGAVVGSCQFDVRITGGLIPAAAVLTVPSCSLRVQAIDVEEGGDTVSGTVTLSLSGAFGTVTSNTVTTQVFLNDDGELFVVNPVTRVEVDMEIQP